MFGPGAVFITSIAIMGNVKHWGGPADIVFLVIVGLAMAARMLDDAASRPSRARYCAGLAVVAVVLRTAAHFGAGLL